MLALSLAAVHAHVASSTTVPSSSMLDDDGGFDTDNSVTFVFMLSRHGAKVPRPTNFSRLLSPGSVRFCGNPFYEHECTEYIESKFGAPPGSLEQVLSTRLSIGRPVSASSVPFRPRVPHRSALADSSAALFCQNALRCSRAMGRAARTLYDGTYPELSTACDAIAGIVDNYTRDQQACHRAAIRAFAVALRPSEAHARVLVCTSRRAACGVVSLRAGWETRYICADADGIFRRLGLPHRRLRRSADATHTRRGLRKKVPHARV